MNTLQKVRGVTRTPLLSPGGTRTHNLQLGMPALCPVELRMFSGCRMEDFTNRVKEAP